METNRLSMLFGQIIVIMTNSFKEIWRIPLKQTTISTLLMLFLFVLSVPRRLAQTLIKQLAPVNSATAFTIPTHRRSEDLS